MVAALVLTTSHLPPDNSNILQPYGLLSTRMYALIVLNYMISELLSQSMLESERYRANRCLNHDSPLGPVDGERAGFAEGGAPVVAGPGGVDA
jgi:hypothetical protein